MKTRICNQLFVKDEFRDKQHVGTVKCVCCGEESHMPFKFPFPLEELSKFLKPFVAFHKAKGCNKEKLPSPEWAAREFNAGIS